MRLGARWLGLALAALAGVVVAAVLVGPRLGGTAGSPSALPSASAASDGSSTPLPSEISSPTPLPSLISLPIPSWDPEVGTLVLRLWLESTEATHVLTVLEDGHIITTWPNGAEIPLGGGAAERRLTAAGIQLLRDELAATGLDLLASADYFPAGPVDGFPNSLEVGLSGGGRAVINWRPGAIGPDVDALDALRARLWPELRLPASAWADPIARPYAAAQYRIVIFAALGSDVNDLPVESSTVSWPLINGIDAFGDVMDIATQEGDANGSGPRHCRVVGVEEATSVIEALEAAQAKTVSPYAIQFELGARAAGRLVYISFEPILPLADTSCASEIPF